MLAAIIQSNNNAIYQIKMGLPPHLITSAHRVPPLCFFSFSLE